MSMMSPLDGSVEMKGWLAYHLESRRPMIIILRATRPDYQELLLMTHCLPCIAPGCCLLFAYLCSRCHSSGTDLSWLSSIWEPVREEVGVRKPRKQALACPATSEHETLNNHLLYPSTREGCSTSCGQGISTGTASAEPYEKSREITNFTDQL